MVHPASATANAPQDCVANRICYFPNANGIYEGTMGQQTANANTETTLIASNFSKTGYGFAGWSDAYDWVINEGSPTNPDAHIYGPNETITTPSNMSNGLSLYAVWVKSEGALQGWTGCSNMGTNSVTALTDLRDGQTYAVAKLADNICWMIENLRLESTNNDNSTGGQAQGYGTSTTYGNFSGLANAEAPWANGSTSANSLYYSGTQSGTASIDIGTLGLPGYRMPRYNNQNTSSRATNPTSANNNIYSYGNYYTWSAAMANTEEMNNYSVSESASTSLCPADWSLQFGGNKARMENDGGNGFWILIVYVLNDRVNPANYSSSAIPYYTGTTEGAAVSKLVRSYPNNFLYAGYISSSLIGSRGSDGYYWSASANSPNYAYNLLFQSTSVYPGTNYSYKYFGMSVRCVTYEQSAWE